MIHPHADEDLLLEDLFDMKMSLSKEKRQHYLTAIEQGKQAGLKALREAKEMSYIVVDLDVRKIVKAAISAAITSVVAKGCALKAIGTALGALSEVACQHYDNYCAIREKLAYAKRCSEVVESLKNEMLRLERSPHKIE